MAISVITGSYSGIGRAVRDQLEAQGDRVIGVDIRDAEVNADLSTPEGRQSAIEQVLELSAGAIDRVIVAAGLDGVRCMKTLQLNYFGSVELVDAFKPAMVGRPNPSVVVVSSNASQFTDQYDSLTVAALLEGDVDKATEAFEVEAEGAAYGLSKHAVVRAMRRRAVEWGSDGVRINAIVPGMTRTPMFQRVLDDPKMSQFVDMIPVPLNRTAAPEEIADAVCFLLSDRATFVHGSVLWVDGGCDAAIRPDRF